MPDRRGRSRGPFSFPTRTATVGRLEIGANFLACWFALPVWDRVIRSF
jgi:hypothetical protein